jgi:hypothetical protein
MPKRFNSPNRLLYMRQANQDKRAKEKREFERRERAALEERRISPATTPSLSRKKHNSSISSRDV